MPLVSDTVQSNPYSLCLSIPCAEFIFHAFESPPRYVMKFLAGLWCAEFGPTSPENVSLGDDVAGSFSKVLGLEHN